MANQIKNFDKPTLNHLRAQIDNALMTVGSKYGITFSLGGIKYQADSFRVRLEANLGGPALSQNDIAAQRLVKNGYLYNLNESALGHVITSRGESFQFIGLNTGRAYKYPYLYQNVRTGKTFKFTEAFKPQNKRSSK